MSPGAPDAVGTHGYATPCGVLSSDAKTSVFGAGGNDGSASTLERVQALFVFTEIVIRLLILGDLCKQKIEIGSVNGSSIGQPSRVVPLATAARHRVSERTFSVVSGSQAKSRRTASTFATSTPNPWLAIHPVAASLPGWRSSAAIPLTPVPSFASAGHRILRRGSPDLAEIKELGCELPHSPQLEQAAIPPGDEQALPCQVDVPKPLGLPIR